MKRTHTCGELNRNHLGEEVRLSGWVHKIRDHGGVFFIDLRDRYGITQVVLNPEFIPEAHAGEKGQGSGAPPDPRKPTRDPQSAIPDPQSLPGRLRPEFVISAWGTVMERPEGTVNPKLATGEIEVKARKLELLSESRTPPFPISDDVQVNEEIRLKYRYLDLRRPRMLRNLILRDKVVLTARNFLSQEGFLEIETPILTKSTPEGARDYLVPSRIEPGSFYALPQSPQLLKQLLMVGGIDKYFQISRCFRDEDLRADRQPEFTQIDMEMSFVEQDDVFRVVEGMMCACFKAGLGIEIDTPFRRISHPDALDMYGTDKPDTRYGFLIRDVTEPARQSSYEVFRSIIEEGGVVKGIRLPGCARYSRKNIADLAAFASGFGSFSKRALGPGAAPGGSTQAAGETPDGASLLLRKEAKFGATGLSYIKIGEGEVSSPLAKFFEPSVLQSLLRELEAQKGDLVILTAGEKRKVNESLGAVRTKVAAEEGHVPSGQFSFLWVVDFPLFTYNEEEQQYESEHHPFTSPAEEDVALLDTDPSRVRSASYDLVLNGIEVGSGSVRIHNAEVQKKVFRILKLTEQEINDRFGFFTEALQYGTPPHAGIAPGLDRIIRIMAGADSIRDVIAFPKTQKASDLMTGSPSPVSERQLKELYLKIVT